MGPRRARFDGRSNDFARDLFGGLPGRYDLLAEVLSFGQNRRWRTAMVGAVTAAPRLGTVLDVASGTAGVALMLAERTAARVTGIDVTDQMLRTGRERVRARGADDRIELVCGRAEALPFPDNAFDAVTFTYLLRYVDDPAATLRELARVLRPGGVMAGLEFAVPPDRWWHVAWLGYTRLVLPVAGAVTGGREWYEVGRFLGPSISRHYRLYPVCWTVEAWQRAGMQDVTVRRMSLGGGLVMHGRRAAVPA